MVKRSKNRPRQRQPLERLEARQLLSVAGTGNGLVANYYAGTELSNLVHTRIDPAVNFNWGSGSPAISVPANMFSARWTGKVQAQFTETYTFYTESDEGVALWVNGQKIIDNFTDHTLVEDAGTISLKAGEMYDIRLDYYEMAFDASIKLSWSSASTGKQVIPQPQLYADAGWTTGAFLNTDIGSPVFAGSVTSTGRTTFNVSGGGSGAGGNADQLQYFYQTLNGDGAIVAQVTRTEGSAGGAEAGVMIRSSLAANAPFAAMTINSLGVEQFEFRTSSGAPANSSNGSGSGGLYWLKLVRDGNFIRGYGSSSGAESTWTYFGSSNVPMNRTVYIGLTAAGGTGLNRAQFKNVKVLATPPLGAGLDAVRDYSLGNVFVDVAKQMRTPQAPNLGPAIPFDSLGNPAADFWTVLISGTINTGHLYAGTYKMSFTGQADLEFWNTPGGQVLNKSYNAATNTTTADIVINPSDSSEQWYFSMNFRNTRRTSASALNTGITNLKIIRPGYDPNTTQTFTNLYLEHLKQFSVLRYMDWTATNNNQSVNWSDRTLPTHARQSSTNGVAWEHVIELANQLDKDLWINIPAKASNDYVTQLATLLKNTLEPDRVVYVEYSNEVWNGIFTQNAENFQLALAEVASGNSPLNADGETNQIYWAWRRVAKRSKEISDLFASVFGSSQTNVRIRTVVGGQFANSLTIQQGLEFIERAYGNPGQYFYGIASAPYFASSTLESSGVTVDQILTSLGNSINNKQYFGWDSLARRYSLQNMVYEGGPDTAGANNIQTKINASLDPRMKDLVAKYLNDWYNAGGGLFTWFVTGPTNWTTANGTWGLTNHVENLTSPKLLATVQVASTPRLSLAYGIAVPAAFDARAVAGATVPYANTYWRNPGKGKMFDYFLRVPKAGNYQIIFNAATTGSNEQLRVAINGSDTRTITLNLTPSATTFTDNIVGTFRLEEGMNLLHVTSVNETAWNLQTVTVKPAPAPSAAPTIVNPAAASPTTITGKTTNLSVLGADDGGEANLRYSWEAVNDQATTVTFSANGSNAAKNTVATFSRPGAYTLRVTISDGVSTASSSVNVTVTQTITSVSVAPSGQAIANGETKQLIATARDQFGVQLFAQPSFSWQVDNGFGTVTQTGLYQSPASGLGTATVRATANGASGTASVITQSPRAADNPANTLPGIEYKYFEGSWTVLPDFDVMTPISSGLLNNISLAVRQRNDNFGLQYNGYIYVPTTGTYTFYLTSDDGSKLWVGGQMLINNDGRHSAIEKTGQIILDQGWHSFKLAYFDGTGNETLSWSISGPSIAKQTIPNANLARVNRPPVVITPPAAQPGIVTGTTTNLSVFGGDEAGESGLTYTWSALTLPNGAPAPTFSANGTNASKNTTATFHRAGNYQLQIAISDGMLTTNATINIVVDATLTTLQISPINPTVRQLRSLQFSATGYDQFGNALANQPSYIWQVSPNGGSITNSGFYTAPDVVGTYTVTVSNNGTSASTNVTVAADAAPYVVNQPTATPNPVTGTQATLNVLGGDDNGGEAGLIYSWSAVFIPDGATLPTYSVNGNNQAKQTVATFSTPGSYLLAVNISDGYKSITATLEVTVGGQQNTAPVVVTPASASPATVTGTTTDLSVLGGDDAGESNLTYTWSLTGTPPAAVSYLVNGTNAAKNTTATFTTAGTYHFVVTISDGALTTTSNVTVNVVPATTTISMSPASVSVAHNASQQFTATALDQFGTALAAQPSFTWWVSSTGNGGTITGTGLYTAPPSGTPTDFVRAGADGKVGTAAVTVVAPSSGSLFTNNQDIGGPSLAGSVSYNSSTGVYTVTASGADIWNSADQFHYVYKSFSGDGEIVARVASVQNTHSRAKAGVMFRDTLAAGSRMAMIVLAPDQQISVQQRSATDGSAVTQNVATTGAPQWVRLVKSGSNMIGYRSTDGAIWTQVGTPVTVAMNSTFYVGLALTSHNNAQLNTSTFDNVSIVQSAARTETVSTTTDATTKKDTEKKDAKSKSAEILTTLPADQYVVTLTPKK